MSFAETRLESGLIIYGTAGGSGYSTSVVTLNSGFEYRNKNWQNSRGRWEFGERSVPSAELHSIEGFFRARGGRYQGFRFKDWANYKVTKDALTEINVTTQGTLSLTTTTVAQLYKKVTSGSDVELQMIRKPIASTVLIYKNGTLQTLTSQYTLDDTTGLVTFLSAPGAATLTWTGQFDTPVRFDTDEFKARLDAGMPTMTAPYDLSETFYYLFSLPLVEVRV